MGSTLSLIAMGALSLGGVQAASQPNGSPLPTHAIALVSSVSAYARLSALPTVVVSATYPTETVPPEPASVPTTAWEHIPPTVAAQLGAYLVPLNSGIWITLIGPRGMHGTATLGDDGSTGLTLTNGHTRLQFSLEGTHVLAAELERTLFPAAGQVDNQMIAGSWTPASLLHPATIAYRQNHHLALFAYHNSKGQQVYGFGYYNGQRDLPGLAAEGVIVSYEASGPDARLAPWVVYAAKQMVTSPLHAFVVGRIPIKLAVGPSHDTMTVPRGTTIQGLAVSAGVKEQSVAWVHVPDFVESSVPVAPLIPGETHGFPVWGLIPTGPFTIQLSSGNARTLRVSGSTQMVTQIAPLELTAGGTVAPQNLVSLLQVTKTHWLLYRVANEGVGAKRATIETLEAVKLKPNQSPVSLTTFSVKPRTRAFIGSLRNQVVYDVSSTLTPSLDRLTLVNLSTGQQQPLLPSALQGAKVRLRVDGSIHVVTLKPVPTI